MTGGGHIGSALERVPLGWRLIGLDQDPTARAAAAERLAPFAERVQIVATNFADFTPDTHALMVLADLGVSSPQLDVAARGFSFRLDGPLDMRMNPDQGTETAEQLIGRLEESELADLIYAYGEERLSRRIARRIKSDLASQGAYSGTAALAYAVAGCYPPKARRGRIHPATRTFQALRIAVNDELGVLDRLLQRAPDWLEPGGRLGIISFHSLEDRRVKTAFLRDERLERLTRKPVVASTEEQESNPLQPQCQVATGSEGRCRLIRSGGWRWPFSCVALPGTLLPVLPGLLWLPVGAGLWCWHVGWSAGWPPLLLATVTFAFGLIADLLAVSLATAKLQAGRWSAPAAVVGLGFGLFAGGVGVLIGPWLNWPPAWRHGRCAMAISGARLGCPRCPFDAGRSGSCGRTAGEPGGSAAAGADRGGGVCAAHRPLRNSARSSEPNSCR